MKPVHLLVLTATLTSSPALAQTAAELLTVTAIQSTLDRSLSIRLPSGTSFVNNPRYATALAPTLFGAEAARYGDLRLYVARGVATRLADAYVANLATGFAAAGFLQSGTRTVRSGADTWTRTDFSDDTGRTIALFVSRRADGVYFLTAHAR